MLFFLVELVNKSHFCISQNQIDRKQFTYPMILAIVSGLCFSISTASGPSSTEVIEGIRRSASIHPRPHIFCSPDSRCCRAREEQPPDRSYIVLTVSSSFITSGAATKGRRSLVGVSEYSSSVEES